MPRAINLYAIRNVFLFPSHESSLFISTIDIRCKIYDFLAVNFIAYLSERERERVRVHQVTKYERVLYLKIFFHHRQG